MARYDLVVRRSVARDLRGLPRPDVRRILKRIEALADDPRPLGCEKLSALDRYRVRQDNYRIIYEVNDGQVTIVVVKVGHRRNVYRQG